jgi:hypothetical protein
MEKKLCYFVFQAFKNEAPPDVIIPTDEDMKTEGKKAPKPNRDEIVRKTKSRFHRDNNQP